MYSGLSGKDFRLLWLANRWPNPIKKILGWVIFKASSYVYVPFNSKPLNIEYWKGNFEVLTWKSFFKDNLEMVKNVRVVQSYPLTLTGPFIFRCWPPHYCRVNSRGTIVEVTFISKLTENCFFSLPPTVLFLIKGSDDEELKFVVFWAAQLKQFDIK